MFGLPVVASMLTLGAVPSIGAFLGTTRSPEVLARLQTQSGGQVRFGQPGDPLLDQYQAMRSLIDNQLEMANQMVSQVREVLENPDQIRAITTYNDLYAVPPAMQLPIVMYPPVRKLLEEGRIYGYGFKPENLPEEDVYGRLLSNGTAYSDEDKETIRWYWESTDPQLTDEELDMIRQTRGWIDTFLYEQLSDNGEYRDPTDPANRIGKRKRIEVETE